MTPQSANEQTDRPAGQRERKTIARRWVKITGGLIVLLVGATGGYRYYLARAAVRDVLPTFTEPGLGPRAPGGAMAFGLTVGKSSFAEARARATAVGLDCKDTSMRALMQTAREDKRREVAAAAARGDSPDAVSGASMINRRSPKEANPQVRWSCEGTAASAVARLEGDGEGVRVAGQGRLLMVFDSPAHPVRHLSFERTFVAADAEHALAEFSRARLSAQARFGTASRCTGVEANELAWLTPVECEWSFSDLRVRTTAIHYGPRGIVVGETVEVPWPVRADAPNRPQLVSARRGGGRLRMDSDGNRTHVDER